MKSEEKESAETSSGGTSFFKRNEKGELKYKKTIVAGGTGLSTAAVVWLYSMFVTQSEFKERTNKIDQEFLKYRQTESIQWQRISNLETTISHLKGTHETLMFYISGGRVPWVTAPPIPTPVVISTNAP